MIWNLEDFFSWLTFPYKQFSKVGLGGSRFFLRFLKLTQWNRWCSTVSVWLPQCLHIGGTSGSILFLWPFNIICPVLSRKMLHWSFLSKLLIGSFGLGFGRCWYSCLPLSSSIQLLYRTKLLGCFDLIFVFTPRSAAARKKKKSCFCVVLRFYVFSKGFLVFLICLTFLIFDFSLKAVA